ncbi:unnamed protein product [Prunus armeniaca]
MELTKATRFGHSTENLGNGLLMLVEVWKKMRKVGDIRFDPYEFVNVIGDGDQPFYPGCELLILQGDLLPKGNTLPSSMWKKGKYSILKEGVPVKVVWYFPPIPRKSVDGHMSHPVDSPSWKLVDDK